MDPELQRHLEAHAEQPHSTSEPYYVQHILPLWRPLFAELPLENCPPHLHWRELKAQARALISLVGYSVVPPALAAAWVQPEFLLAIGTDKSLADRTGFLPLQIITQSAGQQVIVEKLQCDDESPELGIYTGIAAFLRNHNLQPSQVLVDVTGGTKKMTTCAASAAFQHGLRLLYVDNRFYEQELRRPKATSEYPRLLRNPLEDLGVREYERIRESFNRGDFSEARRRAQDLEERVYDLRPARLYAQLAEGYGAWDRFDFSSANAALETALHEIKRFQRDLSEMHVAELLPQLREHCRLIRVLKTPAPEDPEAAWLLVANHYAAAVRRLDQNRLEEAVLLLYATVERYVRVCLLQGFGLDADAPDYERVDLDEETFHAAAEGLIDKYKRREGLPGVLHFATGLQVLRALDKSLTPKNLLGPLKGLSNLRNFTPYQHGLWPKPLIREDVVRKSESVRELLDCHPRASEVMAREEKHLKFPALARP